MTPTLPPATPSPTLAAEEPTEIPPTPTNPIQIENVHLAFIQMLDEKYGWGTGYRGDTAGSILSTQDGGDSWTDRSPPAVGGDGEPSLKISSWNFFDEYFAWATLSPLESMAVPDRITIWKTEDSGSTWQPSETLSMPEMMDFFIPDEMHFVSPLSGWLLVHLGAGMNHDYIAIYRTTDGGNHWDLVSDPNRTPELQGCMKTGMQFVSPQTGWLTIDCQGVVDGAQVFQTTDGAKSWSQINLTSPSSAPDLFDKAYCSTHSPHFLSEQTGILVLECFAREGFKTVESYLYWSDDGGATWVTSVYPGGSLQVVETSLLALGNQIYLSHDEGATWSATGMVSFEAQFSFINDRQGWALPQTDSQNKLLMTEDTGGTWQTILPRMISN